MLSEAERTTFGQIADALIPAAHAMPAFSQSGADPVYLDRVLTMRPELLAPLQKGLAAAASSPDADAPVDLFVSWYATQQRGGVHSPEVCLPGGGWEIAALEKIEATDMPVPDFQLNRAIIQQGTQRMLVYYWFEQQGKRTASGLTAKMQLLAGKITNGRNDSGLVRLITMIDTEAAAEGRTSSPRSPA